jgi:3-oxoadipate enol-lactonase
MVERTPPEGYVACGAAIRDADQRAEVAGIAAPTLVIAGRHDPATPPADGRALSDAISGARYVELEASHLSNVRGPTHSPRSWPPSCRVDEGGHG